MKPLTSTNEALYGGRMTLFHERALSLCFVANLGIHDQNTIPTRPDLVRVFYPRQARCGLLGRLCA